MHPSSLPGGDGIGDIGEEARTFVDFLELAKQSVWQMLPLGPTNSQDFHSPYSCVSAFAGNPLLISIDDLVEDGLLDKKTVTHQRKKHRRVSSGVGKRADAPRVDFDAVSSFKYPLLSIAAKNFTGRASEALLKRFTGENPWIDEYCRFATLRRRFNVNREHWPADYRFAQNRNQTTSMSADENCTEHREHLVTQYLFFSQWKKLRSYAKKRNVYLFGDLPIYVASDSADVWAHPEFFEVNRETGAPSLISGVPPDSFNADGQLWGHPLYKWKNLKQDGFSWWIERFRVLSVVFDLVRVDHFRGFASFWAVPAGAKNARGGTWKKCPGHELFTAVRDALGELPCFVEDLGHITPDVHVLRDSFGFMSTRVLQFALDGDPSATTKSPDHPVNIVHNSVVYTGTHDNAPVAQWFNELPPRNKAKIRSLLNDCNTEEVPDQFVRLAMSSAARFCIVPMQDVLGTGKPSRMNYPGTQSKLNWSWRMKSIPKGCAKKLAHLSDVYERRMNLK